MKVYEALQKAEHEDHRQVLDTPVQFGDGLVQPQTTDAPKDAPVPSYPPWERRGSSADSVIRGQKWRISARLGKAQFRHAASSTMLILGRERLRQANEQFQVLRASVEDWAAEHNRRLILVTSALRGEGKSFVALNLAAAIAKPESPVLLIDADFRAPALHKAFNVAPLRTFRDYLLGEAQFAECLCQTAVPGLTLVAAAGANNFPSAAAFANARAREFMNLARQLTPAHYVLVDAPASLVAPETQILARFMDAALLVVKANHTSRDMVNRSLDVLKDLPVCGTVLNYFTQPYSAARQVESYPSALDPEAESSVE